MVSIARAAFAFILLFLASPALAQGSQQCGTLTSCPVVSLPLSGAELLYIVQQGISKKMTVGDLSVAIVTPTILNPTSSPITCTPNAVVFVQVGAPAIVNLPANPPAGTTCRIKDALGVASKWNITIIPTGSTIDKQSNLVIQYNWTAVFVQYNGTAWFIM